jgi:hypothetical protein
MARGAVSYILRAKPSNVSCSIAAFIASTEPPCTEVARLNCQHGRKAGRACPLQRNLPKMEKNSILTVGDYRNQGTWMTSDASRAGLAT